MFQITTVLESSKLCRSDSVNVTGLFINCLQLSSRRKQRLALLHRLHCKDGVAALLKTHVKIFPTGNEESRRTGRVWNEASPKEVRTWRPSPTSDDTNILNDKILFLWASPSLNYWIKWKTIEWVVEIVCFAFVIDVKCSHCVYSPRVYMCCYSNTPKYIQTVAQVKQTL